MKPKSSALRIVLTISVIAACCCVVAVLCAKGYYFGRAIFEETEGTSEDPVQYTIVINDGTSVTDVAEELEEAGFIDDKLVFTAQKYIYGSVILTGTYVIDSNMTGKDILDVISGLTVDAEGS